MIIEEREFAFTAAAPLRAWRLFRVRADAEGWILSSPMFHDPDPPPWPRVLSKATCHKGHPAPAPGCRCGIYAVVEGTLDSLPGYLLDTAYDPDPWAYAELACSGRLFLDNRGVRAECAEVLRIALAESCWPDAASFAAVRRRLGSIYAVPVGGLEDVPEWVTANLRPQGPPPDEANLDLDTFDVMPE